jgi:protein CpxP
MAIALYVFIKRGMKMKKQLLTIATLACFTFANIPLAMAKAGQKDSPMRAFSELNLTQEQKEEIRTIFKTARENSSIYEADKAEIRAQMDSLMAMPAWDEAAARSIITAQIERGKSDALNRAKAKNQAYNLLNAEQKASLAEKTSKRASKHDNSDGLKHNKKGKKRMKRLIKALDLNDEQIAGFKAIDEATQAKKLASKETGKAHHAQMKDIIRATTFDESAWLALHDNALNDMVERKLIDLKAKYDKGAILSAEQKEKFEKIKKKMERKHGKSRNASRGTH